MWLMLTLRRVKVLHKRRICRVIVDEQESTQGLTCPTPMSKHLDPGITAALAAAALFGVGTPFAKLLLTQTSPWMLAALLYLGSGLGLLCLRLIRRSTAVRLPRAEAAWLAGAVLFGGVIAPVLLMTGLSAMPASAAALLLNAEAVFTALLAWFAFKENFDRRIALGMVAIVLGALVISSNGFAVDGSWFASFWPSLAILGACFAWGLDNNLTRKVSLTDATWIAMVKGLVAGITNLVLAFALGAHLPAPLQIAGAGLVGFLSYGASLVLFVVALRQLGTARTGAYFSVATFFGALVAVILLDEPITYQLMIGGALMAVGVWLHLTEQHEHEHLHEPIQHEHEHTHNSADPHHQHAHDEPVAEGTSHTHLHQHEKIKHQHVHFPDAHHTHSH